MVELTLLALAGSAEDVSNALIENLGALCTAVSDADADTPGETAHFGEPGMAAATADWPRSVVKALFIDADAASVAATRLLATLAIGHIHVQDIATVADQDWVRLTQSQFTPTAITPDFWVVPSWHAPPASAARVIRLDPGMAFGTGTHPTTRMCLRWIAQRAPARAAPWRRVLDYGAGSGILAIGAALHGALAIDAVDIDPEAIKASAANAAANGVVLNAGPPEAAQGLYDLVLANILATPLKLLAPLLCQHVDGGGELVLAGLLKRQAEEIAAVYEPWIALSVADHDDGWVLMSGSRHVPTTGVVLP